MDDWKLPVSDTVLSLTVDELILLDWVLCPSSQFIPGLTLDTALLWHDTRLKIWHTLVRIEGETPYRDDPDKEYDLELDIINAKALFAVVPPTFRFPPPPTVNTCPDTGYNLKGKLYLFITGDSISVVTKDDAVSDESVKGGI